MKFKICFLLAAVIFITSVSAEDNIIQVMDDISENILETAESVGGEWAVIGLSRRIDWDGSRYIRTLEDYLRENDGVLSENKYTEYSRTVIALSALGVDAHDIAGFDLTEPLFDYDKVTYQGINGSVFALLALDSVNSDENKDIKEKYISDILGAQLPDGGFAMAGESAEADITAMAVSALAGHSDDDDVGEAIDRAIFCLSEIQGADGSYTNEGTSTAESTAQVVVALCEAGIDLEDERFVKGSNSVIDALMGFYKDGGFCHIKDGEINEMATQQAFYALVAYERILDGRTSLFDMSDIKIEEKENEQKEAEQVRKSFSDIGDSRYKNEIEILAGMGIINGMTETEFEPEANITRAQFAVLVVNAAGFEEETIQNFTDVPADSWYAPYVGAAWKEGIISGMTETEFVPANNITREQAASMAARCARAMGENIEMSESEIRDMLAQFPDYKECSEWAEGALAYCYKNGMLSQEELEISPREYAKRDEVAGMIYGLVNLVK